MLATAARKVAVYGEAIRFEHSIFALPFAYTAMLLAGAGWPGWGDALLITAAMVGARTGAMAANRLIDAKIDAANPRTADRALPSGAMHRLEMGALMLVGYAVLVVCAWLLDPLALLLSPVAILVVTLYPYAKRFTYLGHWILGLADSIAVAGAWIAIAGRLDLPGVYLALAMTFWIAGFDIIYACQDIAVDRAQRLHSIPARFSIGTGLWLTRLSHLLATAALAAVGLTAGLGWPYWAGVVVVLLILTYEGTIVKPNDLSRLPKAFFDLNGYVAIILLAVVVLGLAAA